MKRDELFFDSSSLKTYLECQRKYYWQYVRNLIPLRERTPLGFGTAIHKALEIWYSSDQAQEEECIHEFLELWDDKPHDTLRTRDRGEKLLRGYFKRYPRNSEPFKFLTPPEQKLKINLEGRVYLGRVDAIIKLGGYNYVLDHKTSSRMGAYYFDQFRPDLQMTGYCLMASKLLNIPIHGACINVLYMTKTKTDYIRDIVSREEFEYLEFVNIILTLMNEIESKPWEKESQERQNSLIRSAWMPNWTSCGNWGGCEYKELCLSEDPEPLTSTMFEEYHWHPFNGKEESKPCLNKQ